MKAQKNMHLWMDASSSWMLLLLPLLIKCGWVLANQTAMPQPLGWL